MWLATEKGFYSIVINHESKSEGSEIIIRARKKDDLENLNTGRKIHVNKNKDYAYRIFVSRHLLLKLLIQLGSELDYSNFKNHIKSIPSQKDKAESYGRIWSIMNDYQENFIKGLYNFGRGFYNHFLPKVY
jgi:hypothetical protein